MSVQDRFPQFLEDQRAFFDTLITEEWNTYDSLVWDAIRNYEISELFKIVRPQSILDVGCGCGFHDRGMAEYEFVQKVHAIDYSSKSVDKANEVYPHPKVERWVSDLSVDKPRQTYELVVSFQVFEHLSDVAAYFRFCFEACEQGGTIAIFTPNRVRLSNRMRGLRGLTPQLCDPQHFKEYTVGEVAEMGRKFGFSLFASFGYGFENLKILNGLSHDRLLRIGKLLPMVASCFCIVMRKSN